MLRPVHEQAWPGVGVPHTKTARKLGNLTAFQIFEEFRTTGNVAYLRRWHEYETASHQRRQLTASRGLFERYGVRDSNRSDEELAGEDEGGDDLLALPVETWRAIRSNVEELLIAARCGGLLGAALWLTERGLGWQQVAAPLRR